MQRPAQLRPERERLAARRLADLPLFIAELQVEAAGGPGLRRVGHECGHVGLGVVAVDHDLVDARNHRVPLGSGHPGVGVGPRTVVVVDVAVVVATADYRDVP